MHARSAWCVVVCGWASAALAGSADPQIKTDHPWYPGELACSTFERLAAHQAEVWTRVVGSEPVSDQDKALAAWLWRNTHYFHGEEGAQDLWGRGFTAGGDLRTREYWLGLFGHGFGLCGTTHSQWTAEMQVLLGHNRGRGLGVAGHNAFEVFLTGGPYGEGRWALLDHDLSTVVFDPEGERLLGAEEVRADLRRLTDRKFRPERQHGWVISGLHPADAASYARYQTAEYFAGYAGPPPMVHLRAGETFRRYLEPGLGDERTFVFWGRNYRSGGVPGPERNLTWVNQPDAMYKKSPGGCPGRTGQARYGNAVYVWRPDFAGGGYREGLVSEAPGQVVLEFATPYIIAATPADESPWGVYAAGARNGLVLRGRAGCPVAVSVDRGRTWIDCGAFRDGMDLTDHVKGRRQWRLRLGAGAAALAGSGLAITTVCQANPAVMPRLRDGANRIEFAASGRAVVSAGPEIAAASTHVVEGGFGTPTVTLEIAVPAGATFAGVHAAAHVNSGSPPRPDVKHRIDWSADGGRTWRPVVAD